MTEGLDFSLSSDSLSVRGQTDSPADLRRYVEVLSRAAEVWEMIQRDSGSHRDGGDAPAAPGEA